VTVLENSAASPIASCLMVRESIGWASPRQAVP
jgi:hypothetical protein